MNYPLYEPYPGGTKSIYHVIGRKCACKGTGLIPPDPLVKNKVYCPTHRVRRTWPQLQTDGSVQFKELNSKGLV